MVQEDIASIAILGTLDSVAALSNLAVLVLVFRSHRTRTVSNLLVAALSLTELLMTILVVPFSILSFSKTWRYGARFCTTHGYLRNFLASSSAVFVSAISIEKYYFLTNPMRHIAHVSGQRVFSTALFIWFQSALWAAFPLFDIGALKYLFIPSKMTCGFAWDLEGLYHLYYFVVFMGSFLMPTFTIVLMSYKTLQTARRNANQIRPGNIRIQVSQNGEYTSVMQREQFASLKANLILVTITGTFLVCRFPLALLNITTAIRGSSFVPEQVESIFSWLLYLGSLVNPYVYTLSNQRIRREIAQVAKWVKSPAPEDQEPKDILEYLRTLTESSASQGGGQFGGRTTPTGDNASGVARTSSQPVVVMELQVLNEIEEIRPTQHSPGNNLVTIHANFTAGRRP